MIEWQRSALKLLFPRGRVAGREERGWRVLETFWREPMTLLGAWCLRSDDLLEHRVQYLKSRALTSLTGWHYLAPNISPTLFFSVYDHVDCRWTSERVPAILWSEVLLFQNWVKFLWILWILHNCWDLWLLGPFWEMHSRPKRRRSSIFHFLPRAKAQSWTWCIYPSLRWYVSISTY